MVFFFKQKTAYERRISDWSSDVCSSDLTVVSGASHQGGCHVPAHALGCADLSSSASRAGQLPVGGSVARARRRCRCRRGAGPATESRLEAAGESARAIARTPEHPILDRLRPDLPGPGVPEAETGRETGREKV